MSKMEDYLDWLTSNSVAVLSHTSGSFFGATTNRVFAKIEKPEIAEKFFKVFKSDFPEIKVEELSFPVLVYFVNDFDLDKVKISFFYESDIVRESFDQLVTDYEAKLAAKADTTRIVEILEGDSDAFCVDLRQIVYISKVRGHEKYNPANFSIGYRNSEPIRVEFQSTAKAKEANAELSKLFKEI